MSGKTIFDQMGKQSGELVSLLTKGTAGGKSSGKRTANQLMMNMRFVNTVSVYKLMAHFLKGAYENKPRKSSFLNLFMKHNMSRLKLYFTKDEMAAEVRVVAPYHVSDGSLESIYIMPLGNILISSVCTPGEFAITDATTLGEVSEALLSQNPYMSAGDQFSILHLVQSLTPEGTPQVFMRLHEFILDKSSPVPFYTKIPQGMFFITGGHVGTDAGAEEGGVAYVLSRSYGSKLLVSPQCIVLTPGYTLYQKYSSDEQKQKAMESYGSPEPYYLNPSNKLPCSFLI